MRGFVVIAIAVLALAVTPAAQAKNAPPPKHDDAGCCFQFDNSPVTIVFCQVPNSCVIGAKP